MTTLYTITLLVICSTISALSAEKPTGNKTAEGVACDAIQAYIDCDSKAWLKTLVRPIYGDENNKKYTKFKEDMVKMTDRNKANKAFVAPKIIKVFKARPFSMNGPGSMAYALHKMTGNLFVDVLVDTGDGKTQSIRYHILREEDKTWYFEPRPDLAPLLSMGMNKESASKEVLWEVKKDKPIKKANKMLGSDSK